MDKQHRELGLVKLVQVQPNGLRIKTPGETPTGSFYDPTRLLPVDKLVINALGIEATTPKGEHVLDIHHISHPKKKYDRDDLVSIGFTSHYAAMRDHFGEHMVDGIAGENIIIEVENEVWLEDLGKQIGFENADTGEVSLLDVLQFAKPCAEFSQFSLGMQREKVPTEKMKSTLQFLGKGRRGFLLIISEGQEPFSVQAGDRVFVIK